MSESEGVSEVRNLVVSSPCPSLNPCRKCSLRPSPKSQKISCTSPSLLRTRIQAHVQTIVRVRSTLV